MNYAEAHDMWTTTRCRKLSHNTYLERDDAEVPVYHVRFHATRIITFYADGTVVLNSGGWLTPTTKQRINEFQSVASIQQDRGVWYVYAVYAGNRDHAYTFADGVAFSPDGIVKGDGPDPRATQKLRKRVDHYSRAFIRELRDFKVPAPGPGDCWFCSMVDSENKTWGEHSGGQSHILGHIEESYFVPSLLSRAAEVGGVSRAAGWYLAARWDPNATDEQRERHRNGVFGLRANGAKPSSESIEERQLRKALAGYCRQQLGLVR